MRVSLATLCLASLVAVVAADPHGPSHGGHDAIAKRRRDQDSATQTLAVRLDGDHDLDDVPDDLEYDGDDDNDASWFADEPEEDDDNDTPYEFDSHDNGTTPVIIERDLEDRAYYRKAGLAWTNEVKKGLPSFKNKNMFGLYTWSEWCPVEAKQNNIRCFPMLWGDKNRDKFKKTVKAGYASYALGMNEPNINAQSRMSPGKAAWMWRTYMMPLQKKGYRLISPALANGKTAIPWLKEYKRICPQCWKSTECVAVHYYGTNADTIIKYLKDVHTQLGKCIWVTELGCQSFAGKPQCSQGQANAYLDKVLGFMESQSWIHSYFWYGTFVNSRVGVSRVNALYKSTQGTLSSFGYKYLAKGN